MIIIIIINSVLDGPRKFLLQSFSYSCWKPQRTVN